MNDLTNLEQNELQQYEAVIERGLQTFYEVGQALMAIRARPQFYRQYGTFEDYCRERWQLKRSYAYEIMAASEVMNDLSGIPDIPINVAQIRPLISLEPDERREAWQVAIASAANGKVTARHVETAVAIVKQVDQPHVSYNSGENEWYTPSRLIEAARQVMGTIDIDPASSAIANKTVGATVYFSKEENGLLQDWNGNVWLNPPYAQPLITQFANRCRAEYKAGHLRQACILVNNATETVWFREFLSCSSAICLIQGRVKFLDAYGNPGAPLQGQIVLYIGKNTDVFKDMFNEWGAILNVTAV